MPYAEPLHSTVIEHRHSLDSQSLASSSHSQPAPTHRRWSSTSDSPAFDVQHVRNHGVGSTAAARTTTEIEDLSNGLRISTSEGNVPEEDVEEGLTFVARRGSGSNGIEGSKRVHHKASFFIQPPTPERENANVTSPFPPAQDGFPSSSTAAYPSASSSRSEISPPPTQSSSLLNLTKYSQVLPQVRSPPRRKEILPSSSSSAADAHAGTNATEDNVSGFTHTDSLQLMRRGRRPRLFGFGFTEIGAGPGLDSGSSSGTSSSAPSRDNSPSRTAGGLEMIPRRAHPDRTLRATNSLGLDRDKPSSLGIHDDSSIPVSDTTSSTQRPAAPVRTASIPARIPHHIAPRSTRSSLSSRLAAQRGEGALKLDLEGIKANQHAGPSTLSPIIRKKSGEVLKPSLKSSSYQDVSSLKDYTGYRSAPTTPSAIPKYVHFDTQLEKVKLFRGDQKPEVVSRDASPNDFDTSEGEFPFTPTDEESEASKQQLEIRLPNFPTNRLDNADDDIMLESIFLTPDRKALTGGIRVKNIAFEKRVVVRYTNDWWQTTSEITGQYKESLKTGFDRFTFTLKLQDMLNKIEDRTLFIALRYNADGKEMWDNNGGHNYQVNFAKVSVSTRGGLVPKRGSSPLPVGMGRGLATSQWSVAGNTQDRMADLRAHLDRLSADDFSSSPPDERRNKSFSPPRNLSSSSARKQNNGSPLQTPKADGKLPSSNSLKGKYSFEQTFSADRGVRKLSPSFRINDLPPQIIATGPSTEFYSPRLSVIGLPDADSPFKGAAATTSSPSHSPTPRPSTLQPEPLPKSYFEPAAPKATNGVLSPPSSGSSQISLPKMYADSPRISSSSSSPIFPNSVWDRSWAANRNNSSSQDASPPSATNSESSLTSSDSPPSPSRLNFPELRLTMSSESSLKPSPPKDLGSLSYESILEHFCWAHNNLQSTLPAHKRTYSSDHIEYAPSGEKTPTVARSLDFGNYFPQTPTSATSRPIDLKPASGQRCSPRQTPLSSPSMSSPCIS